MRTLQQPQPAIVIHIQPRALSPPAIAAMLGCSCFFVEECWRDGSLKYKILGESRVSTIEQIEQWFAKIPEQTGKLPDRGKNFQRIKVL